MRNDSPRAVSCAVCGTTDFKRLLSIRRDGPHGELVNWVENRGRLYLLCNTCAPTTFLTEGMFGPVFCAQDPPRETRGIVTVFENDEMRLDYCTHESTRWRGDGWIECQGCECLWVEGTVIPAPHPILVKKT